MSGQLMLVRLDSLILGYRQGSSKAKRERAVENGNLKGMVVARNLADPT